MDGKTERPDIARQCWRCKKDVFVAEGSSMMFEVVEGVLHPVHRACYRCKILNTESLEVTKSPEVESIHVCRATEEGDRVTIHGRTVYDKRDAWLQLDGSWGREICEIEVGKSLQVIDHFGEDSPIKPDPELN